MAAWGKGWGVGRKLRVQYPGAIYHLMNRGDRREPIFKYDADRARFPGDLGPANLCQKFGPTPSPTPSRPLLGPTPSPSPRAYLGAKESCGYEIGLSIAA